MTGQCAWGNDTISKHELKTFERVIDGLFNKLNIDVVFTNHFYDRLNDVRNKEQITLCELSSIFTSLFKKYGKHLEDAGRSHSDIEEMVKSISTNINIPFVLKWDKRTHKVDLVTKTIMRKKNFKTTTRTLRVENMLEKSYHELYEESESEYQKFFKKKLKKYGVCSPDELSKEDRAKFFSEIEKEWTKDED